MKYSVVTPARDEAENLRRLASAMCRQTVLPQEWLIVDDGSIDDTADVACRLADEHRWVRCLQLDRRSDRARRGRPVVHAFQASLAQLTEPPDILVKIDADLSFEPSFFKRLTSAFAADEALGMAGGSCYELMQDGVWRQLFNTRDTVWGACRAYRWACLQDVLPLEERQGWDEIDSLKANVHGWATRTLLDLPFRHHRRGGCRDGSPWRVWSGQGDVAHYLQYRPSYLILRTAFNAVSESSALAMLWGYAAAFVTRKPRCPDVEIRRYLRSQQRLRALHFRMREARGLTN